MKRSEALEEVYKAQNRVRQAELELEDAQAYLAEANFDLTLSECDHPDTYGETICSDCGAFVDDPELREDSDTFRVMMADITDANHEGLLPYTWGMQYSSF